MKHRFIIYGVVSAAALVALSLFFKYGQPLADSLKLLPSPSASPALTTVWGKVTDAAGKPMPGLLILVGSSGGVTDVKGQYVIALKVDGNPVVHIFSQDMKTQYTDTSRTDPTIHFEGSRGAQHNMMVARL